MALSPVPAGLVIPGNITDMGWEGATIGADAKTNTTDTGPANGAWNGFAGGPVATGRLYVVGPPNTRNSDRAIYMEVRDGDFLAGPNERVQIQAPTLREMPGREGWYSFSSYLNSNINASPSIPWGLFWQIHPTADGSPTVGLTFETGTLSLTIVRYVVDGFANGDYTVHRPWRKPLSQFVSKWVDWRLRIFWSPDDSLGFVQMWVDNVPQTFDFPSGIGASDPSGRNWGRGSQRVRIRTLRPNRNGYMTMSLYRAASTSGTWSCYIDNMRVSDGVGYIEGTNPGDGTTTPPDDPNPAPTYPADDPLDSIMGVTFATAKMQECGANTTRGSVFSLPIDSVTKTVTAIKAFMDGNGTGTGPQSCRAHINLASDGSLVATSQEVQVADGANAGWVSFPFSSPPILSEGVNYYLCLHTGLNAQSARFSNSPSGVTRWGSDDYADGSPTNMLALNPASDGVDIYAVLGDPVASADIAASHSMTFTHDAVLVPAAGQQVTNVAYVLDGPTITYQMGTYREILPDGTVGAEVEWDGSKFIYTT